MKIEITEKEKIDNKDILEFETINNCKIPEDFKRFLFDFNGGRIEPNIYKINKNYDVSINKFISLHDINETRVFIENISNNSFPFALVEGGNYVLIDFDNGCISFWDHEEPYKNYILADNIKDFIDNIEPFDTDTVELSEDQIESVWVDPSFLKQLEEKS